MTKQFIFCYTCNALTERLKNAKATSDAKEATIAYDQMREHIGRVKFPGKHGFRKVEEKQ
jgi:hypothetical protein